MFIVHLKFHKQLIHRIKFFIKPYLIYNIYHLESINPKKSKMISDNKNIRLLKKKKRLQKVNPLHFMTFLKCFSLIECFWLINQPTPRHGLEYIWLLPAVYFMALLKWGEIFSFRKGLGLNIYLFISIIRYLIQPLLITISNGELNNRMPNAEASSYEIAIIIYILECIIAFKTIHYYYGIEFQKYQLQQNKQRRSSKINFAAWTLVIIYIAILAIRMNVWLSGLNILGIKYGEEKSLVLDASFFNVIKCFIFVFLLIKAKITHSKYYFILAIFAGIFNFTSYFGSNRSFIFETALSTISILIAAYPQYKGRIISFTAPFAIVIILVMYITKQFNVENVNDYTITNDSNTLNQYSNIIEEYVNGLWTVARTYQASFNLSIQDSIFAALKDIMDGLSSLRDLPFLKTEIYPLADSLLSSSDIFKKSLHTPLGYAQMMSFSGGMFIIFGSYLGWPFMIFANILIIRFLVRMEIRSLNSNNFYYKYMYTWMACLLALTHCYCLQTIIYCWSKFILFYWLILFINKKSYKSNYIQSRKTQL